jgi:hypothetical protein
MYAAILLLLIKHKAGVWDYAMLIPASIIPAWLALGLLLSKGG